MPNLPQRIDSQWLWIVVVLLAAAIYLPASAYRPFNTKGEPREALTAVAMLESGNWILPKRTQTEFATKPPLSHWFMALASLSRGQVTEFTARLPQLLLGLLSLGSLCLFLTRRTGPHHAFLSSAVLATSGLWLRCSIGARVDMVLAAFLFLSSLAYLDWEERRFEGWRHALVIVLLVAAAVLSKGPVALVLPAAMFFLFALLRGHALRTALRVTVMTIAPALLLAGVWYVCAAMEGGKSFLNVVISENFGRFTGTMSAGMDPHQHSVFYLAGSLLAGFLPWTLLLVFFPWRKLRTLQVRPLRSCISQLRAAAAAQPAIYEFSTLTIIVYFLFFSIPASKRAEYLLPAYPFIALLFSAALIRFWTDLRGVMRVLALSISCAVIIFYLVFLGLCIAGYFGLSVWAQAFYNLAAGQSLALGVLYLVPLLLSVLHVLRLSGLSSERHALYCAFNTYLLVFGVNSFFLPGIAELQSVRPFARQVELKIPSAMRLYDFGSRYEMEFYLKRKMRTFPAKVPQPKPQYYVLVAESDMQAFEKELNNRYHKEIALRSENPYLSHKNQLYVLKITNASAAESDSSPQPQASPGIPSSS